MSKRILLILLLIVVIAAFYYLMTSTSRVADMIFVNGTIYTLDAKNTVAQAVAVRGNRIVDVGLTGEIQTRYRTEKVIDLQGRTMMPGFVDGHCHILGEGTRLHSIDLVGTSSIGQIAEMVKKRVGEILHGEWIYGRGWDQNDWAVKNFPAHDVLDRAAPDNLVILRRVDGHAVWVNKKVMDLAGITAATQEPEGGKIYRDAKGNPTGTFVDNAINLIDKVVPELSDADIEERLALALHECSELGLTEVHDMGVDLQTIQAYKRLIDKGKCPIRVYCLINAPSETADKYLRDGKEVGYGNGLLTVRGIKLYIDGALGSRGAALLDQYSDDPGNRGLTVMSEGEIDTICRNALTGGFQVCTHAIGDRGNHIMLNEYEKILQSAAKGSLSPRWRIEHAQILQPSDIPRFKDLDILPSMQPTHATSDMYWAESRLGPERVKGAYAWQSLLKTGTIMVSGSDFPVENVNPLWGFYAAVTRMDKDGSPAGGWFPDQKMTREQAARSFSQWAAYGAFEEDTKGTIESGKWADLTVFSKDIMQIPPQEILRTETELTMVGGKIVFEKKLSQ